MSGKREFGEIALGVAIGAGILIAKDIYDNRRKNRKINPDRSARRMRRTNPFSLVTFAALINNFELPDLHPVDKLIEALNDMTATARERAAFSRAELRESKRRMIIDTTAVNRSLNGSAASASENGSVPGSEPAVFPDRPVADPSPVAAVINGISLVTGPDSFSYAEKTDIRSLKGGNFQAIDGDTTAGEIAEGIAVRRNTTDDQIKRLEEALFLTEQGIGVAQAVKETKEDLIYRAETALKRVDGKLERLRTEPLPPDLMDRINARATSTFTGAVIEGLTELNSEVTPEKQPVGFTDTPHELPTPPRPHRDAPLVVGPSRINATADSIASRELTTIGDLQDDLDVKAVAKEPASVMGGAVGLAEPFTSVEPEHPVTSPVEADLKSLDELDQSYAKINKRPVDQTIYQAEFETNYPKGTPERQRMEEMWIEAKRLVVTEAGRTREIEFLDGEKIPADQVFASMWGTRDSIERDETRAKYEELLEKHEQDVLDEVNLVAEVQDKVDLIATDEVYVSEITAEDVNGRGRGRWSRFAGSWQAKAMGGILAVAIYPAALYIGNTDLFRPRSTVPVYTPLAQGSLAKAVASPDSAFAQEFGRKDTITVNRDTEMRNIAKKLLFEMSEDRKSQLALELQRKSITEDPRAGESLAQFIASKFQVSLEDPIIMATVQQIIKKDETVSDETDKKIELINTRLMELNKDINYIDKNVKPTVPAGSTVAVPLTPVKEYVEKAMQNFIAIKPTPTLLTSVTISSTPTQTTFQISPAVSPTPVEATP